MDGGSRLVAVHTRHLAIHQNDVERLSLDGVETVLSVAGYVDTTADALEQAPGHELIDIVGQQVPPHNCLYPLRHVLVDAE